MEYILALSVLVALVASSGANIDPRFGNETPLANIIPEDIQTGVHNKLKIKKPVRPFKKIIDGTAARLGEFPYQAGLIGKIPGFKTTCGGALLTANRVLTAAHCWRNGEDEIEMFTVVLGSVSLFRGGVRMQTSKVIMHKKWDPRNSSSAHDIAMVYLPRKVKFSVTIQPIALPSGKVLRNSFVGETVYASGYGLTREGNKKFSLSYIKSQVITNDQCSLTYGYVPFSEMCTSGDDYQSLCHGDSGGPLALFSDSEPILVGIASYIWYNCTIGAPSAYTRVTSHIRWIHAHLDNSTAGF